MPVTARANETTPTPFSLELIKVDCSKCDLDHLNDFNVYVREQKAPGTLFYEFNCKIHGATTLALKEYKLADYDCSNNFEDTFTYTHSENKYTLHLKVSRSAQPHTYQAATCMEATTCIYCGNILEGSTKNPDNHAKTGYYYEKINETQHGKYHSCCDALIETINHKTYYGADCTSPAHCYECKSKFGEPLGHSPNYTVDSKNSSKLIESCTRCSHNKTAALQLKSGADLTYTGNAIEPFEMVYPAGWLGEKTQPAATDYTNNVNVDTSPASCSFTYTNGVAVSNTFSIVPKALENSMVTMEPESSIYNGSYQSKPTYTLTDNGKQLIDGTDYVINGNWTGDFTNAGENTLILDGKGNFNGSITLIYTIDKATPTAELFQTVLPEDAVYTGNDSYSAAVTCTNDQVGAFTVKYNGGTAAPSDAGSYTVTVDVEESNNYVAATDLVLGSFVIDKATPTVVPPTAKKLTYDGSEQTLIDAGSTNDGTLVYALEKEGTYTSDLPKASTAGNYEVWYKVIGDENHTDSVPVSVPVNIAKKDPAIGTVTAEPVNNTTDLSAIVLNRENTDVSGNLIVDAGQTLAWGENEIAFTYLPNDTINYKSVTGTVTVTVVDTVAPTGTVSIDDKSWSGILDAIIGSLLFKETKTIKVDAADAVSGIAKVECYDSTEILTEFQIAAIDAWTNMGEDYSLNVTAVDAQTFIYYIRITDKAGNVAYISTADVTYDLTAPVISGVEDGETYYTTQTAAAADDNLLTVTVNGIAVSPITLDGNQDAQYIITATDKAGNKTTVTVTMKPIADLAAPMNDMTEDTVNYDDAVVIDGIIDTIDALLEDENLPADEKSALEDIKEEAEALMDVVEEAHNAVATDAISDTLDVTADNVKPEDKESLEQAKEDLEQALEDYSNNYTDEEIKILEDAIDRIEDALDSIEAVEEMEEQITALPDKAEADDTDTRDKVLKTKEAYDALTAHEKDLVDDAAEKKLNDLVAAVAYKITKGDGSKWTYNTEKGLSFTANGAYSRFVALEIDGKVVNAKYYDAKDGSTIINLKANYLVGLKNGKHTVNVVYSDGEASGTFTVTQNPATGDDSNVALWAGVFGLSVAALAVILVLFKRKRIE